MHWLTDVPTGSRTTRITRTAASQLRMEDYRRRARAARAETLARAFAGIGHGLETVFAGLAGLGRTYRRRQRRQATVRELEALEDHILRDIGLTRGNILAVATRLAENGQEMPEPASPDTDRRRAETPAPARTGSRHPAACEWPCAA